MGYKKSLSPGWRQAFVCNRSSVVYVDDVAGAFFFFLNKFKGFGGGGGPSGAGGSAGLTLLLFSFELLFFSAGGAGAGSAFFFFLNGLILLNISVGDGGGGGGLGGSCAFTAVAATVKPKHSGTTSMYLDNTVRPLFFLIFINGDLF